MQQKQVKFPPSLKKVQASIKSSNLQLDSLDYKQIYQKVRVIPAYDTKNCWVKNYRTEKQRYQEAQRTFKNQHLSKGQFKEPSRIQFRSKMINEQNLKFGLKKRAIHLLDLQYPRQNYSLTPFSKFNKSKWISQADFKVQRVDSPFQCQKHDLYHGGHQETGDILRKKDISKHISPHEFISTVKKDPIGSLIRSSSLRTFQNSIFFKQKQKPMSLQHYKKHTLLHHNVLPYQHSQNYKCIQLKRSLHSKQQRILNNSVAYGIMPRVIKEERRQLKKRRGCHIQYAKSQKRLSLRGDYEDIDSIISRYFD